MSSEISVKQSSLNYVFFKINDLSQKKKYFLLIYFEDSVHSLTINFYEHLSINRLLTRPLQVLTESLI